MEIISTDKSVSPQPKAHGLRPPISWETEIGFSRDNSTTRLGSIDSLGTVQPNCTGTTGRDNSTSKTVWDRMVETLNNTSIAHPLGYRMSDTNVYYEEMDRKWRDLIIFFNKCQVFVGIGPKIS